MAQLLTRPYRRGGETLAIPLGADAGGWTTVAAYDFSEYHARHGTLPAPRYALFARTRTTRDAGQVEVEWLLGGGATPRTIVDVPGDTLPGVSFAVPEPPGADAAARITRVRELPVTTPSPGPGADRWGVVALLGNIAKLLWVLGWEKDAVRSLLLDVRQQRQRALARGASLDLLGQDLRVPRFPAAEYSYDPETIALYHFNDPGNAVVKDETGRFGGTAHDGAKVGAPTGVVGQFAAAFRFPGTGASGAVVIPTHAAFDIPAAQGFSAEAFVKPDPFGSPTPRIVVMKRAQEAVTPLTASGWSLSVGTYRGLANNVMWAVADGTDEVKLFADVDLGDGRFHHVAGVIDRSRQRARLFVDGIERAAADVSAVGAITNAEGVRIGRSGTGNQFFGVIDEVRISRIARAEFHPVLGESDGAYRRRLGIFESWQLPTPDTLTRVINQAVQINNDSESFVVTDANRPVASGTALVRIIPATLAGAQSVDRDGVLGVREADVVGTPEDEPDFDVVYLLRHNRPEVTYGGENTRRMQAPAARALDALVAALSAAGVAGRTVIVKSFDAAAADLHAVGRALALRHDTLTVAQLAVFAHRAGFDLVRNDTGQVYAAVVPGERLDVVIKPRTGADLPPPDVDVFVTRGMDLHVRPENLPAGGLFRWVLIPCGAGRAHFEGHSDDPATLRTAPATRPRLRLVADAPGEITVRVEYAYRGRTITGTRAIRISIETLKDGGSIAGDGTGDVVELAVVGGPTVPFNTIYLIRHNDPAVDYSGVPGNQRMQIALERPLNRLLTLLTAGTLKILKGYDPADPGLHKVGRALRLQHSAVTAGALGALAHRAGFGYVRRDGAEIYASAAPDELIEIAQMPALTPIPAEAVVGTPIPLRARFTTLPAAGDYNWTVEALGPGKGSFATVTRPGTTFTPVSPGLVKVALLYVESDANRVAPYTFDVKLKPALDVPATIIAKPQYDLIMNILNYFHPIGVEVTTRKIREHVVEVRDNLLNAFPGYTYPDFRA
jgi:hypothetical protein